MAALTPTFGSSDLTNFFRSFTETITNRFSALRVPQRDGSIIEQPTVGPKTFSLVGAVYGADDEEVRNKVNSMMLDVQNKGQDKLRLYDDRYLEARLETFQLTLQGRTGLTRGNLNARFRADNVPFWQADTAVNTTQAVVSGDILQFTNSGTADTPGKITIVNGSGGNVTLVKFTLANSLSWAYTGTMANSETLIVDARSFTVTKEAARDLGNWDGSFFSLSPGVNSFEYAGGNVEFQFEYNPRFYTY